MADNDDGCSSATTTAATAWATRQLHRHFPRAAYATLAGLAARVCCKLDELHPGGGETYASAVSWAVHHLKHTLSRSSDMTTSSWAWSLENTMRLLRDRSAAHDDVALVVALRKQLNPRAPANRLPTGFSSAVRCLRPVSQPTTSTGGAHVFRFR